MPRTQHTGLSRTDFLVDAGSAVRNAGRQVAWDEVPNSYRSTPGFTVVIGVGGASAGAAVAIPVEALEGDLPAGTMMVSSDGINSMTLTAAAVAGATSVTADLSDDVLAAAEFAYLGAGDKILKHGEPVEPDSSGDKIIPAVAASGNAFGLLEGPALENDKAAALSGYGVIVGGVVYRTLVPNLDGTKETELKANGMGFRFEDYGDSRAS